MNFLKAVVRRLKPYESVEAIRPGETLRHFVLSASGIHQLYVGTVAVSVSLLNFVPIELQRRIVDLAIAKGNLRALAILGALYLSVLLLYYGMKYILMIYQGWVGESAIKTARDQLAGVASHRLGRANGKSGQTANIIGNEIDAVGGFVGTSISEFIVSVSMMIVVFSYMAYVQPVIALFSLMALIPQFVLARYLQHSLNALVQRQVTLVRELGDEAVDPSPGQTEMLRGARQTIRTIFRNRIELYLLKFGLRTLLNTASSFGSLAVLMVGGYLVIKGQTTIGVVVAFMSGFQRLADPMGDLLDFYRVYSQTKVQYRMIVDWVGNDGPSAA